MFAVLEPLLDPPRGRDDQRHLQRLFVQVVLHNHLVPPTAFAVIGREDDDRVLQVAGIFQSVEHAPDLRVDLFHHPIVAPEVVAPLEFAPVGLLRLALVGDTRRFPRIEPEVGWEWR